MTQPTSPTPPPRRTTLHRLLAAAGGMALGPGLLHHALAADPTPGIRQMEGDVRIDGEPAAPGRQLGLGQRIETGPGAQVTFVVGQDAFLLHEHSSFMMETNAGVLILRYLTGKMLSVFGPGRKQLATPTAAIGIRGTACYIEAEAVRTYFCLCYGHALLIPTGDPARRKSLRTRHHEYPVYIDASASAGASAIQPARVINHSDDELIMLEALVDRRPPFLDTPLSGRRY